MTVKPSTINVYLLAGVKTANSCFTACKKMLEDQLEQDGRQGKVQVLFPYGDYSRNLVKQVLEVRSDLYGGSKGERVGGRQAAREIKQTLGGSEQVLLIGHSGGGAAAYQAARLLEQEGLNNFRVVQIGSPKTPIEPRLQNKVSYFHSVDGSGKTSDPISFIGTWGGWILSRGVVPVWNSFKYAPGYMEGIPTIGGHADYFRHTEPFLDTESRCNLDKTMERVQGWLKGWL
ncbi:hypothetical protein ACX93W_25420 [Paenibacillus sp. CAU 1782]